MTELKTEHSLLKWNIKSALVTLVILLVSISLSPLSCLLILWWRKVTKLPYQEIGLRKPNNWLITIGGGIVLGVILKIIVKSTIMRLVEVDPVNSAFHFIYQDTTKWILFSLMAIPFAGFGEEMVWRGFLFQRLKQPFGDGTFFRIMIVYVTSIVFGGLHYLNQGLTGAVNGFVAGAILGTLYYASKRNLWFVIATHAAWDIFSFTMIYMGWEVAIASIFF